MSFVTNPTLPPKTGYTIVMVNGELQYERINDPSTDPITLLAETTVDHEYRISLLELGVTS
jgi:hypothetical protein